jgi:tetratricopeptide (TPR) repeat protein
LDCETAYQLGLDQDVYDVNIGTIYNWKGDYKNAIKHLNKCIKENPNNAPAFFNRAYTYWKSGDTNKAVSDLDEAITIWPEFTNAYVRRQLIYSELAKIEKDPEKAKEYKNRANEDKQMVLELDPDKEFLKQ